MCDPLFPSELVKPRSSVLSVAYYAENFIVGPQWRGEGGALDPRTFSFYITPSGLLTRRDTRSHEISHRIETMFISKIEYSFG